jgi:hypothetical protein
MPPLTRRTLRFATIDDALTEVDRLVEAAHNNRLSYVGQWTLNVMLNHLAIWAEFAYTGVPLKIPFWMPLIIRPFKRRILKMNMPTGRRLPKVPAGTLGTEDAPLDKALQRFQIAVLRLKNDPPTQPHALFGKMTHAEWMALNLRHAELHLSFAIPAPT